MLCIRRAVLAMAGPILACIITQSVYYLFILFIIKFVQLGTQIKHNVKKRKYTKIHKKYTMKYIKTIS